MKCKEVSDLISWYVDGCLPSNKADAVRRHIEGCACCQADMAAEQVSTKALASPMTSYDAPDVLAHVMGRVSRRQVARPRWQWAFAGVAAACSIVWLALSQQAPRPQQTATNLATGPVATAPQTPEVKVEPKAVSPVVKKSTPEKPRLVRAKSPKPRRTFAHRVPAPKLVVPETEIEYLVVYKHPDMGDGVVVAASDGTDPSNPASSSYSIRMTDDSTGTVTDVSAYTHSDGDTEENATVEFRSETPDADGPERSSTDEIPLYVVGGAARSDRC